MTSTEFAARYRLLKNVATRGARSFLAQQVELGRMVMVHYLDSETPHQRAATLARLEALRPPARHKLVEIVDVDGSPVAVTLFLSSFVDFATWLDLVSADQPVPPPLPAPAIAPPVSAPPVSAPPAVAAPGAFTQAFQKAETLPNEEQRPAHPPRPAGDFTGIFGRFDEPGSGAAPSAAPAAESEQVDTPTLIMKPVKTPRSPEPAHAPPPPPRSPESAYVPPPAPPPAPSEGGFTAIFGRLNVPAAPAASMPNAWHDPVASPPPSAPVVPPTLENPPLPPMAPPSSPSSPSSPSFGAPAQPGEFTQLFQRISPAASSSVPSFAAAPPVPLRVPETPRPIETTPGADLSPSPFSEPYLAPPLAVPSLGGGPAFALPPAPNFSDSPPVPNASAIPAPQAAPAPVWGAPALPPALGSSLDVGVQSEFTRILGRVAVPPPPPTPIAPPQAGSPAGAKAPTKSVMPLLVALNVVVLLTIAIVAYFMLRTH